jgi:hypothetical protein
MVLQHQPKDSPLGFKVKRRNGKWQAYTSSGKRFSGKFQTITTLPRGLSKRSGGLIERIENELQRRNSRGVIGTIDNSGVPVIVKVANLGTARHADYREINTQGTGDGEKDFRFNAADGVVYWWQLHNVSAEERQKTKDWLEAEGYVVNGNKDVRDNFEAAHGSFV